MKNEMNVKQKRKNLNSISVIFILMKFDVKMEMMRKQSLQKNEYELRKWKRGIYGEILKNKNTYFLYRLINANISLLKRWRKIAEYSVLICQQKFKTIMFKTSHIFFFIFNRKINQFYFLENTNNSTHMKCDIAFLFFKTSSQFRYIYEPLPVFFLMSHTTSEFDQMMNTCNGNSNELTMNSVN